MPNVLKTDQSIEIFNPERLIISLGKETGLPELISREITVSVTRKIISANLKIVTGPLIREMICGELLVRGLEKERTKYSRIGMPYFDFFALTSNGHSLSEIKDIVYTKMLNDYLGLNKMFKTLSEDKSL